MYVWCLLDSKQNSRFIWTELINPPKTLERERPSRERPSQMLLLSHLSRSDIVWLCLSAACRTELANSVSKVTKPDPFHRFTQTFPLENNNNNNNNKRTRHTGDQLSFSFDWTEIKQHLFNASDTAMVVRMDPFLGLWRPDGKGRGPL